MRNKIDNNYLRFENSQVYFSKKDIGKIKKMKGRIVVISTVCPDYPNDGSKYTFSGSLGEGVSLTAFSHLYAVPSFIDAIKDRDVSWLILVADLPELVDSQREFFERVAGSKEEYIRRCIKSAESIQKVASTATVKTFSQFYTDFDYMSVQEDVAKRILITANESKEFRSKFTNFMMNRAELARSFRGRSLSTEELRQASAHGMSLYITHGTLLRFLFKDSNVILVNHLTPNLGNFHLASFVNGYEYLVDSQKIPVGIIESNLY